MRRQVEAISSRWSEAFLFGCSGAQTGADRHFLTGSLAELPFNAGRLTATKQIRDTIRPVACCPHAAYFAILKVFRFRATVTGTMMVRLRMIRHRVGGGIGILIAGGRQIRYELEYSEWPLASMWCKLVQGSIRGAVAMSAVKRGKSRLHTGSTTRASVSFPPELYRNLEHIAKQKKVSIAWVVREAAEKYIVDQLPQLAKR